MERSDHFIRHVVFWIVLGMGLYNPILSFAQGHAMKNVRPHLQTASAACGLGGLINEDVWSTGKGENQFTKQFLVKADITFQTLHSDPRWTEQLKKRGLAD